MRVRYVCIQTSRINQATLCPDMEAPEPRITPQTNGGNRNHVHINLLHEAAALEVRARGIRERSAALQDYLDDLSDAVCCLDDEAAALDSAARALRQRARATLLRMSIS